MSDTIVYEATVYARTISYRNFKGEETSVELYFSLDPLLLMEQISNFSPRKVKSGNPARHGLTEITEEQQIRFIRDLASRAAGSPSDDGEVWEPFEDFADSLAGKAFLTKLTSSDGDRKEFAEKVILAPFRSFVGYALADTSNSEKDKQEFRTMLAQMENIFKVPEQPAETVEERAARLRAELEAIEGTPEVSE